MALLFKGAGGEEEQGE